MESQRSEFENDKKIDNAHYFIDIAHDNLLVIVEYKFTKGGWENVEIDKYHNTTANKKVKKTDKESNNKAEKWRINWESFKKEFFPNVELIDDAANNTALHNRRLVKL
ncbi:hypothetical protein ACK1KB_09025 [Chryseobacterium sp. TY3]